LEGYSEKAVLPNDIPHLPRGDYHPKSDKLNVAESEGAVHRGSFVEQWGYLQKNTGQYKDFATRWKVLTIWMFANDVCGECNGPMDLTVWLKGYNTLLTNITTTYTNIYINLESMLDLSNIARLQRSKLFCDIEHHILSECGCIDKGNATQLAQLDANVHSMNAALHTLVKTWQAKWKADGRADIHMTMQGYLEHQGKQFTESFLNNLDCFHPSAEAHNDLAIGLWNSMLCHDRTTLCNISIPANGEMVPTCTRLAFRHGDALENAIGSQACSLKASMCVMQKYASRMFILLPVDAVNSVQTLKVLAQMITFTLVLM
jgi:hypothetical protein